MPGQAKRKKTVRLKLNTIRWDFAGLRKIIMYVVEFPSNEANTAL